MSRPKPKRPPTPWEALHDAAHRLADADADDDRAYERAAEELRAAAVAFQAPCCKPRKSGGGTP